MRRIMHLAVQVSGSGASALCFKRPKAINMATSTWTTSEKALRHHDPSKVSTRPCPRCLAVMDRRANGGRAVADLKRIQAELTNGEIDLAGLDDVAKWALGLVDVVDDCRPDPEHLESNQP